MVYGWDGLWLAIDLVVHARFADRVVDGLLGLHSKDKTEVMAEWADMELSDCKSVMIDPGSVHRRAVVEAVDAIEGNVVN